VVKLLLDIGSDVKKKDVRGETPLHTAAFYSDNGAMIDLLISKGADVNSGSPENTPLHRAAYSGAAENISLLILHGAKVNIRGNLSGSKTPFELAVDNKHFKAARILAENGADINSETYYYFQPFRYRNYKQTYTEKLVKMDTSQIRFEKMPPLHRTITHNDLDFVKYLVDKGAGLKTDSHFGGYPLDFSIYLGYYDISEFLVSRKAPSLYAEIYLRDAVENNDYRKAELLLRAGADVNEVHDTFRDTGAVQNLSSKNIYKKMILDSLQLYLEYLFDIMCHAYKTKFTVYLMNPAQTESIELHIPFYIPKDTFDVYTSFFP
jgi:ankyrin repeat protein